MAVLTELTLPGQPASGESRLVPLNGDGFTSPKSLYEVQVLSTGDAGGGNNQINITLDPRFVSLVVRMELVNLGGSSAVEYQLTQRLVASGLSSAVVGLTVVNTTSAFSPCSVFWDPPGILPIDLITAVVANVDTIVSILSVWIYNFDINALNTVPIHRLLRSLPRTSGVTVQL